MTRGNEGAYFQILNSLKDRAEYLKKSFSRIVRNIVGYYVLNFFS